MLVQTIYTQTTASGHLVLDVPTHFLNKNLEVVLVINEPKAVKQPYNFSEIAGKLTWSGDAVAEQRKLRDEWK